MTSKNYRIDMIEYPTDTIFTDPNLASTLGTDFSQKDIMLGAYFTGKAHPQHHVKVQAASFDYIAGWLHSGIRLGLNMLIFHDGLPETFINKCHCYHAKACTARNQSTLHFVQCTTGPFTIADERFLIAETFLQRHPCRNVFMVDVSDAWFGKSPFTLLHRRNWWTYMDTGRLLTVRSVEGLTAFCKEQWKHWRNKHHYRLFLGGEINTIGENAWMRKHFTKVYGKEFPHLADKPVLNCGIIGGSCTDVCTLLQLVREEMCQLGVTDILNDMVVFNKILHERFTDVVYSNGVLNSPWKTWAKHGKFAIFHK